MVSLNVEKHLKCRRVEKERISWLEREREREGERYREREKEGERGRER